MRCVIYGAGAIGGLLGAALHAAGEHVVLVARGSHYEALRSDGLRHVTPDGRSRRLTIDVVDRIDAAGPTAGDLVFLSMKSQDTEEALRRLALVAPPEVTVVCVQNGVENERLALRRFSHVYGVLVVCPAVHLRPGVIESGAAPKLGILDVGRYPRGVDRAEAISTLLRRAGYLSQVRDSIMDWKYAKLLLNLDTTLTAIAGPAAAESALSVRLRAEGEAALEAAGIAFTSSEEFAQRRQELTPHWAGASTGSSWQSLQRAAGSIEADFLNGEIVLQGTAHGVEVSVNAAVQSLARQLMRDGGRPGTVTLDQIERAVKVHARR